ncbi:pyruvate dehydrogenase complex dihydrolipoamide acetyltransferase [Primorskyibacter marinus]|uniref:pyruvate dehydrogenase complex dihydrolipoamide acetyltransferase n=1 Tax=Primorskyibacter marinus TaxID=1977320 RepID=UPI000E30A886|nr:pyruvate dehydrogenase complex dihydrolipoamide acetyltransferase [Primorskyibacter marinus]
MPTEILMPALSPTMEEGTLAKWLVKEGDTVSSGDIIAEIETDKATMEFEAVDEGTIGKIIITEGTEGIKVNTPIAVLLEEGESETDIPAKTGQKPPQNTSSETPPAPAPEPGPRAPAAPKSDSGDRIFASPLARRIAAQNNLDLGQIKGSGPHGRIIRADVEGTPTQAAAPASATQGRADAPPSIPPASSGQIAKTYTDRPHKEVPLDGMRKTIAARLTEAKQQIPHFYLRRDIQLDALLKFRADLNAQLDARGIKLSVNDFIIKACALALQQVPAANAVWAGDRILQLTPSDVAVAVAIEGGLFTPVLKDAEKKTLTTLSAEMKDLAARARDRKLGPHEYQGGSFAISNLGMFGVENFDAVINPPHGAILAVGAGIKKPVVGPDGDLTAATIMSVTLSVDHRVIDGALGAELLAAIKENLENPMVMLA